MARARPETWSVERFLEWERQQPEPYEFTEGTIIAMTGGSLAHATIRDNVVRAFHDQLRDRPCRVFGEGPKVVTGVASHYPDVTVTCSEVDLADDRVPEPVIVVEVLSPTTADRDRGAKWQVYQDIPSLQHYLLVAQDRRRIDLFTRTADGWHLQVVLPPRSTAELRALAIRLDLDAVYADTDI